MKYPDNHRPLQNPKRHCAFIRSLPCARCNGQNALDYKIDGDWRMSLPLCNPCIIDVMGGYGFRDKEAARVLAHKLDLYFSDNYTAGMIIANSKERVFI